MMNIPEQQPLYMGPSQLPAQLEGGLTKGGMYSIQVESAPTRLSLVSHALFINLARGIRCTLITRLTLEEFLAHTNQKMAEFFLNAAEEKKLLFFSMVGDFPKNLFRFGAERFLYELEQFRVPNDGFIVMDHADLLFAAEDDASGPSQARSYQRWMRKTGNTALFLFLHAADNESHHARLQNLSDHFSGLAKLDIGRDGLEVGVDFWALQGSIIMAKRFAVTADDNGQLNVAPSLIVNRRHLQRPDNEEKPDNVIDFSDGRQRSSDCV